MSQQIDDGGSAFPVHANHAVYNGKVVAVYEPGMKLRDWFAGQVLAGYLAGRYNSPHDIPTNYETSRVACDCYAYADAMITARKGGDQ